MNPFLIQGPAVISFSGGRTSAYMLFKIIEAHGGTLPDDVVVAFANTGKEREETLRFVHECETRWNVRIYWIEWRDTAGIFERVGFNSASRLGEPFKVLIAKKQRLPNWQERWCTSFLKLKPLFALAASLGWVAGHYAEVIGLRDDEGHRILKGFENAEKDGRKVAYPLARARVRKADVMEFWRAMPFDLGLEPWEGNCDLCFMKGRGIRKRLIRDNPSIAIWWRDCETSREGVFDRRDRVADLVEEVRRTPGLFDAFDPEEYDVECGLHCALEAAE
ncbi:MAG: 3-phosphoadenosine 5-phosphosulfate sulfotransferase reductase/FAD synthetase [Bradyrhizobium sp.]|nr:3-phosphoadenosine 5-phosphosulfate sulfotransferase reductase/FAD synthetase [Bradyrhizobium sp.]